LLDKLGKERFLFRHAILRARLVSGPGKRRSLLSNLSDIVTDDRYPLVEFAKSEDVCHWVSLP
jgi:hypothetical protein